MSNLTHNDLQAHLTNYPDGLIDGNEMICITKAYVRNEPTPVATPPVEPCNSLQIAFTTQGIQSLLTRIQAARELGEGTSIGDWIVSPDAKTVAIRVILRGDTVPANAASSDHEWLMPRIEFPLPAGSITGDVLPDQYRVLTITQGFLHFK